MYLYLIERTDPVGYDEYDSFVVCAETVDDARKCIKPEWSADRIEVFQSEEHTRWIRLGEADSSTKEGVILGSFNAG